MSEAEPRPAALAKPLDAIPRVDYDEWRSLPATEALVKGLREDIATVKQLLLEEAKAFYPNQERIHCFGAQLYAKEIALAYITERADG